jgi:hypothetical protein
VADVVILTEDAPEVAMSQEDGPGPMISDERRFFPKVGKDARDHQLGPGLAVPDLILQPVHPAFSRAEPALPENLMEGPDSFSQFSAFVKPDIGGEGGHLNIILPEMLVSS